MNGTVHVLPPGSALPYIQSDYDRQAKDQAEDVLGSADDPTEEVRDFPPYDFRTKTQGYVTLLFFGYTHCPDMCPLQMYMIADALKKIPPAAANQSKVVFVTPPKF
jgi:cytochrome oxidase Cu insertion factor (SCO1/SenC/PrrC family)